MPEHNFTLILTGPVDERLDALYEAGCDDATFGEVDGVPYAEFDREADTLTSAILTAVTDVESVPDVRVTRVEPDDLVTMSEIAERLGRTRESVRLLIAGKRGPGAFPAPASHLRDRNRLWRWSEVAAWAGSTSDHDARLVAALNAALQLRVHTPQLDEDERAVVSRVATTA